jgi:hypothetical protein
VKASPAIRRSPNGGATRACPQWQYIDHSPELEKLVMNCIRSIYPLAGVLAGLAAAVLALSATTPAALASRTPPFGGLTERGPAPPPVHVIVTGGMPGWQITLIAVGAAVLTGTAAVIVDRARAARRQLTAPSV